MRTAKADNIDGGCRRCTLHSNGIALPLRWVYVNIFFHCTTFMLPHLSATRLWYGGEGRKTMRGRAIYRGSGVIAQDVLRHIVRFCRTHVHDSTQIRGPLLLGLFTDFLSLWLPLEVNQSVIVTSKTIYAHETGLLHMKTISEPLQGRESMNICVKNEMERLH